MLHIGCHLSSSKGFKNMGLTALSIGANTFQFFTRNPRGGKAKEIDEKDVQEFLKLAEENNFTKLVAHAPYTVNPCSKEANIREFARMIIEDDLKRMEYLPGNYYNFHPGSHVGQGADAGIEIIADLLNELMTPNQSTIVLLETMSGKGSEVGSRFEELKAIIDRVELKDRIGVCMDTCHVNDAGYDIVHDLDGVLSEFDNIIGLEKLYAMHINDSLNTLSAHKDRHAKIGEGYIGLDGISNIINHPKLRHLPFILETPNELDGYAKEISLLKDHYKY
ncbi:deoxyribonuclease IV [Clostridium aminobutyricum]|uniref:Probable endonuclease 4 n=1 Tax=Clostridium aminobutyricum TaxID=33953 RepID=A0A939D601_CLOAM|nr:deoxyribonuclease IV [Clostridium aminobutyricum]MBN7771994.1 deoxyribonuclease IV [Clostridium aminobutyricum]